MFPPFEKWCDDVLHPEDTHPWNFRTKEFYEEYKTKYAIAKMIQPDSIIEVGVRFGYSAYSFLLAAPHVMYTGLDIDEPSWGPYEGIPRLWAQRRLRDTYPNASIETCLCDTQEDTSPLLLPTHADMVHIDADHSFLGALHDMTIFWSYCNRVMVIDDYTQIREVTEAVTAFMVANKDAILLETASLRGSAIIVKDRP